LYQKHYSAWKLAAARWLVRRKMRDEIRCADKSLSRGETDRTTHAQFIKAYRRVMALYANQQPSTTRHTP
jgi:hypothetical protein